jgi:predicted deacylase
MLNPDGVINGNYRCNLAGSDLNRRWKSPNKILHPIIHAAKRSIKSFAQNHKIDLVIDFHGHSRRKNVFVYGCNIKNEPHLTKIFPYILSKISPVFNYGYSRFNMSKSKAST